MAWQGIEAAKQTIEFPAAPSFFSLKKWIKLIPKTIGNRKRDCAWGCARGINTTWEYLQIEKHKSERRSFRSPNWFVLFDLQIFSGGVYPPSATSRTISFSILWCLWIWRNNDELQWKVMCNCSEIQPNSINQGWPSNCTGFHGHHVMFPWSPRYVKSSLPLLQQATQADSQNCLEQ